MGIIAKIFQEEPAGYFYNMRPASFARAVFVGVMAGAFVGLLAAGIDKFMLAPMLCGNSYNAMICDNSLMTATMISSVLVGIMTVPILAMMGIRRPLVVVLAAVLALWGVVMSTELVSSMLLTALVYGLLYATLVWLNRIRGNGAAILFSIIVVLLARFVISL